MTVPVAKTERVSFAEYLRREERAVDKHEFHNGEMLAMSGGTYEHSRVAANLISSMANRLAGGPCFVLESNMRTRQLQDRHYVYPDALVICGEPAFDPDDRNRTTITNPTAVFEILSASTEAYDRGEKFNLYRGIEILREYVLVSQHHPLVETFLRQDDGSWSLLAYEGQGAVARLRSLDIDLPLAEVYAGIKFPPPGDFSAPA